MALGAVVTVAQTAAGFINFGSSPRFGPNGPLYSTVNAWVDKVVSGDLGVITQLNQMRKTDPRKEGWQKFWDELLPIQPLTAAQVALIKQLDPSKTGIVSRVGAAIYAQPGQALPTIQSVLQGIVHVAPPVSTVTAAGPAPTPPLTNPLAAVSGGLPLWALLLLGGVAAWVVYKMVKKG